MNGLTARQFEIMRCKAAGMTNKEIAYRLGLSPITVKNHITLAYATLSVECFADAMRALGWLRQPEVAA